MNKRLNFPLKSSSILIASMVLVACGGSSTTTTTPTPTPTATAAMTAVVGTWARCNVTGATSNKVVFTFGAITSGPRTGGFSTQQSSQKTDFTDTTCEDDGKLDASIGIGASLSFLGSSVAVDGTVAGITAATQYSGQSIPSTEDFDIIAANATQLFFGDKSTNNATTLALQPTQIESVAYTKQVALTSDELIGTWSECDEDEPTTGSSTKFAATFTASTMSIVETVFGGTTDCGSTTAATSTTPGAPDISTYTLGSSVTVNGTAGGITNATQFTTTDSASTQKFDLIAILGGTQLAIGNTDGAQNGTTEALRANQLEDGPLVKE